MIISELLISNVILAICLTHVMELSSDPILIILLKMIENVIFILLYIVYTKETPSYIFPRVL